MTGRRHRCALFLLAASAFLLPNPSTAQGQTQTIAQSGDAAPDGNGQLNGFFGMFLNDSGDVSFGGALSGTQGGPADDTGVFFMPSGGSIAQVIREGAVANDGNGTVGGIVNVGLNNAGLSLVSSRFSNTAGGSLDDSGIFTGNGGTLTTVAREGTSNGLGEWGDVTQVANYYGINDRGITSIRNVLRDSSGGTIDGVFAFGSSFANTMAREGFPAPGGLGNYTSFSPYTRINENNAVAFEGRIGSIEGVFRTDTPGSIAVPIFVEGDAAPDGNGTLSSVQGFMTMNDRGQVAFEAIMTGTANGSLDSEGVFRGDGNSLVQIMREGNAAPGGNGVFENAFSTTVRLNEAGEVAFAGALRDTDGGFSDNSGIYRSSTSGNFLYEIAREGDAISTGDGQLSQLSSTQIALNEQGHVAFQASLTGTANNSGVFIGDEEELITVVQEGQAMAGSTVSSLQFSGGEDFRSGLNNLGQVVYEATLADGRRLLQQWTPELRWRRSFSSDWDISNYWTLGIAPDATYNVTIDPDLSLTVEGPSSNTTVNSLQIGGGNGIATFEMEHGAVLTATNGVTIESTGVLTGDGSIAGNVLNRGIVQAQNVWVNSTLTNDGVIRGTGRVDANIVNNAVGNIRANNGDVLQLTGPRLTNGGRIEVINGVLEVSAAVDNLAGTGFITGSDAMMRFNGGVNNAGSIGITVGTAHLFGDIANTGVINVSGGAVATFYDDVAQNGTLQVVSVGNTNSAAVFFGELSGGGFVGGGDVFALGDLRPGFSPASILMDGSLYLGATTQSFFELGGLDIGDYDQMIVTGDLSLAGNLSVDLINGFDLTYNDEFLIADVGGMLQGEFTGYSEGSLVGNYGGMDLFITYAGGDGNDVYLFTTVPEPGALSLCGVALVGLAMRFRRQRQV